jgi:hypothetical protein
MFPVVTIHGFGLDRFSMWFLPDPFSNSNKYGFWHTFEASQMFFMRGDFVHAGVPSPVPRGHMKHERFFLTTWLAGSTNLHIGIEKGGNMLRFYSYGKVLIHHSSFHVRPLLI